MNNSRLPLLVEPEQLSARLNDPDLVIVDLAKGETYTQGHVPGAVHLDYQQIITARPPVMGLVPEQAQLEQVMSQLGVTPDTHVVAYDDEGGGRAGRFLYTLDILGHSRYSLLNGGIQAWANEHHPLQTTVNTRTATQYSAVPLQQAPVATKDYILKHLQDNTVTLVDARSAEEFRGEKKFAEKAGHIPGAINLDWVNVMDRSRNLRLKPDAELARLLEQCNIGKDKPVVVYCQTHHRSALLYVALKSQGFSDVKGYPGSWSEWGNSGDTPVEQ